MLQAGIAASLLSLGAIDFGLIVDGSVVMVENAMRRLAGRQRELGRRLTDPSATRRWPPPPLEVSRPAAFGVGIILIVFLPILTLEGVEGKLFRPMALTMIFALLGSLLLSLTLMPGAGELLLPRQVQRERAVAGAAGAPALRAACWTSRCGCRRSTLLAAAVALVAGRRCSPRAWAASFCRSSARAPSSAPPSGWRASRWTRRWRRTLRIEQRLLAEFPDEIAHIWTRLGTAEVATDPMGVELADFFLALKPRERMEAGAHARRS